MQLRAINHTGPPITIDITDKSYSVTWHPEQDDSNESGCTVHCTRLFGNTGSESTKTLYFPYCTHIFIMEQGRTTEKISPPKRKS